MTEKIIRENAFEHKNKKPGLHLTGLSTNQPSNNWALQMFIILIITAVNLRRRNKCSAPLNM